MTEENPGDTKSKMTEEKAEDIDNRITRDDTSGKDTSSSSYFGGHSPTFNDDCTKDMNIRDPAPKMTRENPDDTECKTAEDTASGTDNQKTQDDADASSSVCLEQGGSNKKRKLSDSDNPNKKKDIKEREEKDIKEKEEKCLIDLVDKAGEILLESSNLIQESIDEARKTVIAAFNYSSKNSYEDIDFTLPENVIGYFTRHGPTSAGVARFKISKIMDENKNILNELQNFTSPIKLLDLGTGHGCGIMGLCSSLNKYLKDKCIHLTLVDHVKEWVPVFNIVEFLLRFKDFGEASDFFRNNYISTKYLVFDLSEQANKDKFYERSLIEADVIMISRVFSIQKKYLAIAENVVNEMKIGALLFFIDAMGGSSDPFSTTKLEKIASQEEVNYEFAGTYKSAFEVSTACKAKCFVYRRIIEVKTLDV